MLPLHQQALIKVVGKWNISDGHARIRTWNLMVANHVRYHLRHIPNMTNHSAGNRTQIPSFVDLDAFHYTTERVFIHSTGNRTQILRFEILDACHYTIECCSPYGVFRNSILIHFFFGSFSRVDSICAFSYFCVNGPEVLKLCLNLHLFSISHWHFICVLPSKKLRSV